MSEVKGIMGAGRRFGRGGRAIGTVKVSVFAILVEGEMGIYEYTTRRLVISWSLSETVMGCAWCVFSWLHTCIRLGVYFGA